MSSKNGLSAHDRKFILSVLENLLPAGSQAYFFGSRMNSTFSEGSDLDLLIAANAPIGLDVIAKIRDMFEESDLPFKVDILDNSSLTPSMRQNIMKHAALVLQK
ncbi:MAG: nucleotidyltransferase domain-containing protein [Pseudomonadota bacterium]